MERAQLSAGRSNAAAGKRCLRGLHLRREAFAGPDTCHHREQLAELLRGRRSGEGRNRTGDTTVFSRVLYRLSYLAPL